jgi:rubrerythrin
LPKYKFYALKIKLNVEIRIIINISSIDLIIKSINMEKIIDQMQQSEITEHYIYLNLAKICKDPENRKILEKIAKDELGHYNVWKQITGKEFKPNSFKIWFYTFLAKIFGLTLL